mgnify:CR=1 FL=1
MTVTATLVVGKDGSTSKNGRSAGVASSADRAAFLARRRLADCIIIGGNTARNEPYQRTPVPLVVISHSMINPLVNNRRAHWWNTSAEEAISLASRLFGSNILVEAGPALISTLVANGLIDRLELSVTEIEGGENPLNFNELLKHFTKIHENNIEGTRFITAQK